MRVIRVCAVFLMAAGALRGQADQYRGEWWDMIRLFDNGVTELDLKRVEKHAEWVREYLGRTWYWFMLPYGRHYDAPFTVDGGRLRYSNLSWKCGDGKVAVLDNAYYCPASNSITYDGFFLAGLSKKIGLLNHSPGDFAAITSLAHESGHALQYQLGIRSGYVFPNEQNADCFAGAMTYQLRLAGLLHPTDVAEAKAALTLLADPKRASPLENAHGDAGQRVEAFMSGYRTGADGCTPLKPATLPWLPPRQK